MKTRVRFAPSPTGPLHMGGVRTALYNYLYAKQNGGDFIIRIEDTDSHRFVPGAEKYIIDSLRWCGIIPDEGVDGQGNVVQTPSERHPHAPYRQSERKGIYRKYAERLVENGMAYYAFDSAEELEKARADAEAAGQTFIYSAATRKSLKNSLTLPADKVGELVSGTTDWTIRFKMPENETVVMEDLIRGHMEVNTSTLDDKVLWKRADELPTYHLANIVDDHLMEITEVIRGEEWLPSLPLHYLLYKAFGWEKTMPRFAHLPLLLKPVGNGKLSKRDGDKMGFPVFPLKWVNPEGETFRGYREDGYFPEAFVNLLAMLGWNPGTEQEIFSMDELVKAFSLEKVGKSGAKFNPEKAKWFNREYLRSRSDSELAGMYADLLGSKGIKAASDRILKATAILKERANFVQDFWTIAPYLFIAPSEYGKYGVDLAAADASKPVDPRAKTYDNAATFPFLAKDAEKFWNEDNGRMADEAAAFITGSGVEWTKEAIEQELEGFIKSKEYPIGKVMNCLRLALTGSASGLGIADILSIVGRDELLKRLEYIRERL
ncbi:MAG: glutamate--tRNA ligase [Bacteroidales bacterium]|nr:glutamate--tRNA ligase [Bacteroidales bacterium]